MARTQGAKDSKPRTKKATTKKASVKQVKKTTAPGRKAPSGTDELSAAIEQELNGGGAGQTPSGGAVPGVGSPGQPGAAPVIVETEMVGRAGWQAMLMTPFRMLSLWFDVPAVEQIGAARSGDLAAASYPIYTHYMKEWLESDPEDPLAVAKVTTVAVLVGVSFEVYQAISIEMAKRREAAKREQQEITLP